MASRTEPIEPLIFEPQGQAESAVIFLHGYDDQGSSWTHLIEQFRQAGVLTKTRFILPTAPHNHAAAARSWYEMRASPTVNEAVDASKDDSIETYQDALATVDKLIQDQVDAGLPLSKILLSGFSQGGAVTFLWTLTRPKKLAGAAIVSSYLPLAHKIQEVAEPTNKTDDRTRKALVMHGLSDDLLPVSIIQRSQPKLEQLGFDLDWLEVPQMRHQVSGLGIAVLQTFFANQLE